MKIRDYFGDLEKATIIITTGNIGFFLVRFSLLFGSFNYGRRGILDKDHKRLFTFRSMKRLLESTGFEIQEIQGIPAPYPEAIGKNWISNLLLTINRILIFISKSLFSYQMAFVARPLPNIEHLLTRANRNAKRKRHK